MHTPAQTVDTGARSGLGIVTTLALVAPLLAGCAYLEREVALSDVFPDAALASCVAAALDLSSPTAKVRRLDFDHVEELGCFPEEDLAPGSDPGSVPITDLTGIDQLDHLVALDLSGNDIRDLEPLAGHERLEQLTLADNGLLDLTHLASLPRLTQIGLSGNGIVDLSPLAGMDSLEVLALGDNDIADLGPLATLTGLVMLDVSGNAVGDLAPLAGLPVLTDLSATNSGLVDASGLVDLVALEYVAVGGPELVDVSALLDLPALTVVDVTGSPAGGVVGLDDLEQHGVQIMRLD